jgi:protein-S-isoprenylcysteine O-methyltransferase Ste14
MSYLERKPGIFKFLFLVGLLVEELIRLPHQRRHRQSKKQNSMFHDRISPPGTLLDMFAFAGLEIVPALYVFTPWLDFANYPLIAWVGWSGVVIFAFALWLLWRAHRDLGRQWSPTLAIQIEHTLVMQGVYRYIRHPIYAALWLTGIAQICLLPNWLAGFAGVVCFLPFYLVRAHQEEQSLLGHFGKAYQSYMQRTGRVMPRFGNNATYREA